jgi:hypothetical protein
MVPEGTCKIPILSIEAGAFILLPLPTNEHFENPK